MYNAPGHTRVLMEIYEFDVIFMLTNTLILQTMAQGASLTFNSCYFHFCFTHATSLMVTV